MEGLLASLAVTAFSGVAWFAYKHPAAYKAIELPSMTFKACLLCCASLVSCQYAGVKVHAAILPYVAQDKIEEASRAYKAFTDATEGLFFALCALAALWLFFCFLGQLPDFIRLHENADKE